MKKKFGKVKNYILLIILAMMAGVVVYILINRAQYSDELYRSSDYYEQQNGNYN